MVAIFDHPNHMEPLLPSSGRELLAWLSKECISKIGRLTGQVHSEVTRSKIAGVVRSMNCYYSNLIEGHKTVPRDIERALLSDFSPDLAKRENQELSAAHIALEAKMVGRLAGGEVDIYDPGFICWLHREFYSQLPEAFRAAKTQTGKKYTIEPGKYRDFMVDVGRHTPPGFGSLQKFIGRFCEFYKGTHPRILETDRLVAIAAAHHRLSWIHPFGDGNGRVARLYTHALLTKHDLGGDGLWTLSRGLARQKDKYFQALETADQPRTGDLDGRGNLTDRGLAGFCIFFLETILDQVEFMGSRLDLPGLKGRIERYFQGETGGMYGKKPEFLMRVVRALAEEGEFHRGKVQEITGRSESSCRETIKQGLAGGLFTSPSPKGVLQIAFPAKVLDSYFPKLFLDLDV